jgi:hypothetical protein
MSREGEQPKDQQEDCEAERRPTFPKGPFGAPVDYA